MVNKVNILLSSYNGEKYIKDQIESILAQTYSNFHLFIRDDGSKDGTKYILNEYKNNPKITVFYGDNLGFFASFLWLLNNCDQADFYAFSDQDDYWYPDKIETAINKLKNVSNQNQPLLYCCNADICDANLKLIHKGKPTKYPFSIVRTIVNGETGWGYTQVMNDRLRQFFLEKKPPEYIKVMGHDTWVHLLCLCNGTVIYDPDVHVMMRRHGNNTSRQEYHGGNIILHNFWRLREFLISDKGKDIYNEDKIFYTTFLNSISEDSKKIFYLYMNRGKRIKKVFYRKRYRDSFFDELAIRLLFLIGKM